MKVIKLCADGVCSVKNIENTLEALQHEVGGYIETVTLTLDLVLICDEEGRLKGKKVNEPASIFKQGMVGDVLIVSTDEDDFASVSERLIEWTRKRLLLLGYELEEITNEVTESY